MDVDGPLLWKWFSWLDDPYSMIREVGVHLGYVDLWHVASGALAGCPGACCCPVRRSCGYTWGKAVAVQALFVVCGCFGLQLFVRIVTGCAGEPHVSTLAPAFARDQAI